MFGRLKKKIDHKIHEAKDHTHVTIWAENKVDGHLPEEHRFIGNLSTRKYVCTTNADLWTNFNLAAIQCGPMSENNLGDIESHTVKLTIEGTINGKEVTKTELTSMLKLAELIESFGVKLDYYAQDANKPRI